MKLTKFHISYQVILGSFLVIALILTGAFVIMAFTFRVQDSTTRILAENAHSLETGKDLELYIYDMRVLTLNYLADGDSSWIGELRRKENAFLRSLDDVRLAVNTETEKRLLQQMGALFSNYQQNLRTALVYDRQGNHARAKALLLLGNRDFLNTIQDKCRNFILSNERTQVVYENRIRNNNQVIRYAMYALGIGGIILGTVLGWIIARIILNPIYRLVLKVRGAADNEVVEHISMSPGKELDELDFHIQRLIGRINKAHEDLEKNRKLLERSNRLATIGKLAPALAHEIRNPLAAIKMLVYSMAGDTGVDDERQRDIEIISREVERIEGFIQNFLKFARPPKPTIRPVLFQEVVEETLQLLSLRLKQNNIEVVEDYSTQNALVMADPDQVKQVIMNLVINAIEAMGSSGKLVLRILREKTEQGSQVRSMVKLTCTDSGPGIEPAIMDNLFEPFIKGREKGVGLGLSISQRIAELHQGWIEASNNPEGGACMTLYLPAA
jgi:signal transduction histidine kinase